MVPLGGGSSSSSGSNSDDEDFPDISLFDFDPSPKSEAPVIKEKRTGTRLFWDELFRQSEHVNTIDNIVQADGLTGQLQDPGENNGGLLYVSAIPLGGGANYRLLGSRVEEPGSEPVYWMPWEKRKNRVCAAKLV